MTDFKTIQVSTDIPGVCWIKLNRPNKYNAINFQMYNDLIPTLKAADTDPKCKIIVITGNGKFFTSGNDQTNFVDPDAVDRRNQFRDFIDLLIDVKTIMIALVNGPAVGMGVTMLGHFDLVIASDKATFSTPFARLGLSPEGCSSYLFPQIMGFSNADNMLLFNKKASAQEMLDWGFVSRVFPHEQFEEKTKALIKEVSQNSGQALLEGKALIRPQEMKDNLHKVNHQEFATLGKLSSSPEALEAVVKFFNRKSKL